ncbi:RNA ligase/cyclic nucleotide phosphodiesterase [Colletotrichum cereale]|nr:RNA ligase/cyclic nucleotide phosphodiesterase [Colletotrichum cereale]
MRRSHPYTAGVPSKFASGGTVQPFPGNTFICHLSPSEPLYASMQALSDKLAASKFASLVTLLPAPSFHMTVFEGVCDQVRKPGYWPADLALDAPLAQCDSHFETALSNFDLGPGGRPPYKMTVKGFDPLEIGIGVRLEGRTPAETGRLRALRNRLADALEIRHPTHDGYGFHLSVAYLLRHLDDEQRSELEALLMRHIEEMPKDFELGAPEFCVFNDMFAFKRVFFLQAK